MPFSTLIKYLLGNKQAIFDVAHNRSAVWIGLLLVLSAGLAREYDHESLLHEPWHVLIPLGASTIVAFALFLPVYVMRPREGAKRPRFLHGFRTVLSLVWMTAPLAWLYAIPYERMFDAGTATRANLWTLALVAAWRVLLISRALAIVVNLKSVATFFIVMLLADAIALAMLAIVPLPIINVMGGIALSESESLIAGTSFTVIMLGLLTAPVWLLGALGVIGLSRTAWALPVQSAQPQLAPRTLWFAAAAAIAIGVALLPFTQPAQARRYQAEHALKHGKIQEAVAQMSRHDARDFPPHWDPPPRRGYGEREPDLTLVVEEIERQQAPEWVRQAYLQKLHEQARAELRYYRARESWPKIAERIAEYKTVDDVDRARPMLELILRVDQALVSEDRAAIEGLLTISKPVDGEKLSKRE